MPINPNEELTPETSQEAFTARTYDPMQPVPEEAETNMEAYIKYLYDKTQRLPEKPDTREEYFMMIAGQNIGPGSDVEPLRVTENGTYSEAGKAYSPVTVAVPLGTKSITANGTYDATDDSLKGYSSVSVDVPLPENAYLLKDIPNTPTAIATFSDGANLPMPSLKIGIEPVQGGSGDPSPTNVRPISGWDECNVTRTGKNLWDNEWAHYTRPSDYRICPIKLENGQYAASVKLKEGGTRQSEFTLGIAKRGDRYSNFGSFYTASTGADKTGTITVDDTWTSPKLIIYCSNETAFNDIFDNYEIQLEEGTTATTYEPYAGTTYTIDLDGTRYGGTLDVVNGVLTVDRGYVDLGTLNWVASSAGSRFLATVPSPYYKMTTNAKFICSQYIDDGIGSSERGYYGDNNTVRHNYTPNPSPSAYEIYIHDDRFDTDATAFKTAMDGVQLVYELATPLTIQLTPTAVKSLLGTNNIWADTGDILDGEYWSKTL